MWQNIFFLILGAWMEKIAYGCMKKHSLVKSYKISFCLFFKGGPLGTADPIFKSYDIHAPVVQ